MAARIPQSHGLPSPPARSPHSVFRSIPRTFMPHLPKLGTAKYRLRYNVFGILAYLFIWWQGSIYASAKRALVLCLATIFTENVVLRAINSVENIIFFVLAWNIVEAIYVIRVATLPPAPSASSPSQPQASHFGKSLNTNLKRYTSPFPADTSLSASLNSIFNSSSTLSTPTRVRNESPTLPPHRKQSIGVNAVSRGKSVGSADRIPDSISSLNAYAESPHVPHIGRKSLANGRALDSRILETLLDDGI